MMVMSVWDGGDKCVSIYSARVTVSAHCVRFMYGGGDRGVAMKMEPKSIKL